MGFLKKLLFSDIPEEPLDHGVLANQIQRFKDVWNNNLDPKSTAIGIERVLRLLLVLLQFPFPGIYVRYIFGKWGVLWKNLGIELYVIVKVICAYLILHYQGFGCFSNSWYLNPFSFLVPYMLLESLLYTATLVFCNDIFTTPRSYKRNIILLLCDYVEVILGFGSLYLMGSALKFSCENCGLIDKSLDAAYFSFITAITIGYGDIITANDFGKNLVIFQTVIFLIYGVLFLNFYVSRIEVKTPKEMDSVCGEP